MKRRNISFKIRKFFLFFCVCCCCLFFFCGGGGGGRWAGGGEGVHELSLHVIPLTDSFDGYAKV